MTTIDQLSTKSKSSQHNWVKRVIVEEEEIVVHIKFCEIEIIISQVKSSQPFQQYSFVFRQLILMMD